MLKCDNMAQFREKPQNGEKPLENVLRKERR